MQLSHQDVCVCVRVAVCVCVCVLLLRLVLDHSIWTVTAHWLGLADPGPLAWCISLFMTTVWFRSIKIHSFQRWTFRKHSTLLTVLFFLFFFFQRTSLQEIKYEKKNSKQCAVFSELFILIKFSCLTPAPVLLRACAQGLFWTRIICVL